MCQPRCLRIHGLGYFVLGTAVSAGEVLIYLHHEPNHATLGTPELLHHCFPRVPPPIIFPRLCPNRSDTRREGRGRKGGLPPSPRGTISVKEGTREISWGDGGGHDIMPSPQLRCFGRLVGRLIFLSIKKEFDQH